MRKYLSLLLLFNLCITGFSGLVLYITPHGRVAYWTFWSFLGLKKDQWEAIHIIFGILLLIFGIWHIYLNWRALKNYLLKRATIIFSKEFWVTAVITLGIFILTLFNVPPFSTIINLSESIKTYWEKEVSNPPVPHMELFSLKKVAKYLEISPEQALVILKSKGIKVKSIEETLKSIAQHNHTSPAKIYNLLIKNLENRKTTEFTSGAGWGRKSVKEVCKELGISLGICLKKFEDLGVKATPDATLKEVAFPAGYTPYELIEKLQEKSKR